MKPATGRRIRYVRIRCGLRRTEVGQVLGVSAGTIARWERFEAETVKTTRGNARLAALFASLTKHKAPLALAVALRYALASEDAGLSALSVLLVADQPPH